MGLQSLVLCSDEEVLRQIRVILRDLGIGLQVCSIPEQALELLKFHKFELAVLDSQVSPPHVITGLRESHSNRTTVACSIGALTLPEPPYDLAIPRPFAIEDAWRILREARGRMEQEQQRYYRGEVRLPINVRWKDGECLEAQGCNLSISGMAISAALEAGLRVSLCFTLEGHALELNGEVTWSRAGRSGLRFVDLPDEVRQQLENWVAERRRESEFSFVKSFHEDLEAKLQTLGEQ